MNPLELKGDLLSLLVARAMGGVLDVDLRVPFDEWGCGVIHKGGIFSPEQDVSLIWPQVMKLRISTREVGDGRWHDHHAGADRCTFSGLPAYLLHQLACVPQLRNRVECFRPLSSSHA